MDLNVVLKNKNMVPIKSVWLLERETIKIKNALWKTSGIQEVCEMISEWFIRELDLEYSWLSTIIKVIQPIKYPNLVKLNLRGNNIRSIEGLNRMYMPYIESVNLIQNKITVITDLKKVFWPNFRQFYLDQNQISQFFVFSCLPPICSVQINNSKKKQCQDIRTFMKTRIPKHLLSRDRIMKIFNLRKEQSKKEFSK